MSNLSFRKALNAPGLLNTARQCFDQIKDNNVSRGINLTDCLMSGLAIFGLKYPSLLQFDKNRNDELVKPNLQTLLMVLLKRLVIRTCVNGLMK